MKYYNKIHMEEIEERLHEIELIAMDLDATKTATVRRHIDEVLKSVRALVR